MQAIPITIDGKACGSLSFARQGAYMLCSGQAQYRGEMLRLWLHGKGEPGYLGVLQPGGRVRKKYSLAEFNRLPHPLEYCGPEQARQNRTEDVLWYDMGDGTLRAQLGGKWVRAFPVREITLPRGGSFLLREIEGQQYVVFPG